MRSAVARDVVLAGLLALGSSGCAASHEEMASDPPGPALAAMTPPSDDPALKRRELLELLDDQIDASAARAHLEVRLALDEVYPIPYLGVDSEPVAGGLKITAVYADTGAEQAGLKKGDVLVAMDGARTESKVDLGKAIRSHRVGDRVELRVIRDGSETTLAGTLKKRPEEDEDEEEQFPDLPPRYLPASAPVKIDFGKMAIGSAPEILESALGGHGKPGRWIIATGDHGAVLRQDEADTTGIRFPLALVRDFRDGNTVARVRFRYVGGRVDRAAGIVLRYRDPGHYLVARANAAEGDVRIFRVAGGMRRTLPGGIVKVATDDERWHTLEFRAEGSKLTATLDGTATAVAYDSYLLYGRAGLWTKSDSIVEFDDFTLDPIK